MEHFVRSMDTVWMRCENEDNAYKRAHLRAGWKEGYKTKWLTYEVMFFFGLLIGVML